MLLESLKLFISKQKLKEYFKDKDIESIIDATKNYVGHGVYDRIAMSQKRSEIRNLAEAVKALNTKVIVEIGTRKGGTLFTWCRFTEAQLIISIDLPGGIHGGGYPREKQELYKFFLSDYINRKMFLIQEDSHENSTLQQLEKFLNGKEIDFLFIDGDHTYQGVKMDFEMYSPLVRKGGIIAFHDIIHNTTTHEDAETIEVPIFWNEIKREYKFKEFIESPQQGNMGIGILYK